MTPEEFAGRGLDPLVDELKLIQRQFEVQPRVSWAYVTGLNPLQVRLERDDFPLLGRAQTLVHESMLEVGDRVEVIVQNGRAIVQGKGGGAMPVDGVLGLALHNPANQSFAYLYDRAVFSEVERNDGFTLVYSGANVAAFRPPQDGWYMVTGAVMRQSSGTFTALYGLAPYPLASNNTDYLAGGYFSGAGYFLIDFTKPVYLYKDQEYCAKTYGSAAWSSASTAGSPVYHTRLSVISIDSDAVGIPGPQGPEGPPGPPGGGLLQRSGLIPVIPTSIDKTGAGSQARMSSLGLVEFEDCNNISLNGVFTDDFDNYRVIAKVWNKGGVAESVIYFRMRANGVDYVTAGHITRQLTINNAGASAGSGTESRTAFEIGRFAPEAYSARNSYSVDLYGPALPMITSYTGLFSSHVGGLTNGWVNDDDVFDGLTLSLFTGSYSVISGSIQVFGYAKGEF